MPNDQWFCSDKRWRFMVFWRLPLVFLDSGFILRRYPTVTLVWRLSGSAGALTRCGDWRWFFSLMGSCRSVCLVDCGGGFLTSGWMAVGLWASRCLGFWWCVSSCGGSDPSRRRWLGGWPFGVGSFRCFGFLGFLYWVLGWTFFVRAHFEVISSWFRLSLLGLIQFLLDWFLAS